MLQTILLVGAGLASACGQSPSHASSPDSGAPTYVGRQALVDPVTCLGCHNEHYADWVQSMHAYASDDPVFVAMNARGQRETQGALGTFCVQCHAPMAVRDGLTMDGLNLATLPAQYKGVTCFFCHSVASVDGTHNAELGLATDLAMRAEVQDPVSNLVHASTYSSFTDGNTADGANACGACHDIVVPSTGAAIERTYYEWSHSVFSTSTGSTCIQCHMRPGTAPVQVAQVPTAPLRTYHAHDFVAVDSPIVLADGGVDASAQQQAVQSMLSGGPLQGAPLQGALCVTAAGGIRVILDAAGVGHQWPSGAAQDRRAWAEVIAYKAGAVVYQSGVVADGQAVTEVAGDPDLWLLRDCMVDANDASVNMFWQAATSEGNELPALATYNQLNPAYYQTHILQRFPRTGAPLSQMPDRVTLRIRLQPVGLDVLRDLVQSGDLDPAVITAMPTFDVSLNGPGTTPQLEWTAGATGLLPYANSDDGSPATCVATPVSPPFNVNATRTPATHHTKCSP